MKRRANNNGAVGRDLDIGSRPVETVEQISATQDTQFKTPRMQIVWIALPSVLAVVSTLASPAFIGKWMFWLVTGVVALAAFFWSIAYEMKWQDRVSLPLLAGLFMSCFWIIFDWQGWRVPDSWQPFALLFSIASMLFWWIFTVLAWLTYGQRLAQPITHQQYFIWKAINVWLEFWGKKERPVVQVVDPEIEPIPFEFISANGRVRRNTETPFARGVMVWIARVLQEETLSEESLCGPDKPLPGGKNGRAMLDELKEWMIKYDLMRWNRTNGDGEPIVTQGVSLTADGLRWVEEVGK